MTVEVLGAMNVDRRLKNVPAQTIVKTSMWTRYGFCSVKFLLIPWFRAHFEFCRCSLQVTYSPAVFLYQAKILFECHSSVVWRPSVFADNLCAFPHLHHENFGV